MFETVFMGSLSGWVVVHPNFTIVAPEHGVGFPKLQPRLIVGAHETTATAVHVSLPQSLLDCSSVS